MVWREERRMGRIGLKRGKKGGNGMVWGGETGEVRSEGRGGYGKKKGEWEG